MNHNDKVQPKKAQEVMKKISDLLIRGIATKEKKWFRKIFNSTKPHPISFDGIDCIARQCVR